MKRFSEQFNKKAGSVKLRAAERRELKDRLVAYMEYHPLPAELKPERKLAKAETKTPAMLKSEPFKVLNINFTYLRAAVSTMALLVVVVVPFMAEKSLPGDVLYPVKVQFNEEVRSSLSLSTYAKVEWETERLERRIAEARLLASEGKLTEEVEAEVAEAVKTHSDKAQREIANMRESDEDEAAIAEITFASALAVQSEVLESDDNENAKEKTEGKSVAVLASVVAGEKQEAEAKQAHANPSYKKLLARVESETTRAEELFISISDVASAAEAADIKRRLNDIETKVSTAIAMNSVATDAEAEVAPADQETVPASTTSEEAVSAEISVSSSTKVVASGSSTDEVVDVETTEPEITSEEATLRDKEARALLRSALSDIRKLISFMTNIDVRENVTINDLVPMTLTDDEHIKFINDLLAEVAAGRGSLENRYVTSEMADKFALGIVHLDELVAEAEKLRSEADYNAAHNAASEASLVYMELLNRSTVSAGAEEVVATKEEVASSTDDSEVSTTTEQAEV